MLMNAVLPVAEKMLRQFGEFYPYGGCMRSDGTIVHIGAADSDTDHPKSKDLIYLLKTSLREMAKSNRCKAAAIVFDVAVVLPDSGLRGDAIKVCVEHADGYAVEVFFPYRLIDGEIVYGETYAQQGGRELFSVAETSE